jgi:hypothetical protein
MPNKRALADDPFPPPAVAMPIVLEDDGWFLYCPKCEEAWGPYPRTDKGRAQAARYRGAHLVNVHDGTHFAASGGPYDVQRALRRTRARRARRDQTPT